jgi:DNA polymerase I-like protein with 3'-5' exonuclease and polymerase domains
MTSHLPQLLPPEKTAQKSCSLAIIGDAPFPADCVAQQPWKSGIGRFFGRLWDQARPEGGPKLSDIPSAYVSPSPAPGGFYLNWYKGKMPRGEPEFIKENVFRIEKWLKEIQPTHVLLMGQMALYHFTDQLSVKNYRASVLRNPKFSDTLFIPTHSPQAVFRKRELIPEFRRDLQKFMSKPVCPKPSETLVATNFEQAQALLRGIKNASQKASGQGLSVACDIETRGRFIDCVGFSYRDPDQKESSAPIAFTIPFLRYGGENIFTEAEETNLVVFLRALFKHPNITWVGQNFSYDCSYFMRWWNVCPKNIEDTMVMSHAYDSGMAKGLGDLSATWNPEHIFWKQELDQANAAQDDATRWRYNALDCINTWQVYQGLSEALEKRPSTKIIYKRMMRYWRPLLYMSMKGYQVDQSYIRDVQTYCSEAESSLQKEMADLVGWNFNPKSSIHCKELFLEQLGLPEVKGKKSEGPTFDDATMDAYTQQQPKLRPLTIRMAALKTLGIVHAFSKVSLYWDGRARTSYNVAGTTSGRLASRKTPFRSGGNFQNVTSGSKDGAPFLVPNLRKIFQPDPNRAWIMLDLVGADAFVLAQDANETSMLEVLHAGGSIHKANGELMWNEILEKSDPRYKQIKIGCHGTNYGAGPATIGQALKLSIADAERFQGDYFKARPRIKAWQRAKIEHVEKYGFLETPFKRRRYFHYSSVPGNIYGEILGYIPQSVVADIVMTGICRVWEQFSPEDARPVMQIHDEAIFSVPRRHSTELLFALQKAMTVDVEFPTGILRIPTTIQRATKSWGEADTIKLG